MTCKAQTCINTEGAIRCKDCGRIISTFDIRKLEAENKKLREMLTYADEIIGAHEKFNGNIIGAGAFRKEYAKLDIKVYVKTREALK